MVAINKDSLYAIFHEYLKVSTNGLAFILYNYRPLIIDSRFSWRYVDDALYLRLR